MVRDADMGQDDDRRSCQSSWFMTGGDGSGRDGRPGGMENDEAPIPFTVQIIHITK